MPLGQTVYLREWSDYLDRTITFEAVYTASGFDQKWCAERDSRASFARQRNEANLRRDPPTLRVEVGTEDADCRIQETREAVLGGEGDDVGRLGGLWQISAW